MAKKKGTNTQSQTLDHKTLTPQPPPSTNDDPSVQIQNLKNLNNVLLKETTNHRNRIQLLLKANHAAMDVEDKNLALDLQNDVFFVFVKTQITELGFLFEKIVEEKNEIEYEVSVQREKMKDLGLCLESEKRNVEKMRLDARKLFDEKAERESKVEELEKDRDLAVKKSIESVKVIDELKEKIDLVVKEKNDAEGVNSTQDVKISNLGLELQQLNEVLKSSRNEEAVMRGKIREMEETIEVALEKEREMMVENSKLVGEKKEMEKSIENLTEGRDTVYRTLDMVKRELENRQREVDEARRARDEVEKVKVGYENEVVKLQGEISVLNGAVEEWKIFARESGEKNNGLLSQVNHYRNAIDEVKSMNELNSKKFDEEKKKVENLQSQVVEMEEKIELLLSQVQCYKNAVEEVELERDNIRKGYDDEKNKVEDLEARVTELKLKQDTIMKRYDEATNKVENLELQVVGLKEKIENAEAELVKVSSEKEKMNETNKELGSRIDVLINEKDATHSSLIAAQRECKDLRAKFESSSINSKQALELLKRTVAHVSKESVEVIPRGEKKHEEEIQYFAEELEAIKKAFKAKDELVDDMKKQVASLQKSASDAHKGKNLWAGLSSAATICAFALTAYVAKGR